MMLRPHPGSAEFHQRSVKSVPVVTAEAGSEKPKARAAAARRVLSVLVIVGRIEKSEH
jgi:hypothetical protein